MDQVQKSCLGDGAEVPDVLSTHAVGTRRLPHLQVLDLSVQLLGGEGLAGVGTRTAAAARDVLEGLEAGLGGAVLVSCADLAADRSVCLYEGRGLLAVLHGQTAAVPADGLAWTCALS